MRHFSTSQWNAFQVRYYVPNNSNLRTDLIIGLGVDDVVAHMDEYFEGEYTLVDISLVFPDIYVTREAFEAAQTPT